MPVAFDTTIMGVVPKVIAVTDEQQSEETIIEEENVKVIPENNEIIDTPTKPKREVLRVAGMISTVAIAYEEAPIVDRPPEILVQKNTANTSAKLSPSRDYEVYAMEAPITEYGQETPFPVAPVAVVHGENVTIEPIEKETALESVSIIEEDSLVSPEAYEDSSETKTCEQTVEKKILPKETKVKQTAEEKVIKEAPKKQIEKSKKEKSAPVRPKPSYDISKIVFPSEKKQPKKVKAKVVFKTVKGSDDSSGNK